jgi:hypothetical protein
MLFVFPLVFSFIAAVMFSSGDYSPLTKILFPALAAIAASMQFAPGLSEHVHFLVPLFIQLFICAAWYIASQME